MSAIFGLFNRDNRPANRSDLERMMELLSHRGSDSVGIWTDGPTGLGHRMLWTTPESLNERLPFESKIDELAITADARIDNREELAENLGIRSQELATISDSELVLITYRKFGAECPAKLLGDFAFTIWDKRNQTLFCARDHFGVKPFNYHLSSKLFAWATEIKALLVLNEIPRRLDETRLADYLASVSYDPAATFYQDILRLPPAHALTITPSQVRLERYWTLDPQREVRLKDEREYADALRDLFSEAVRCRMRSAFKVGSMLSGGLDSSSIACTMQKIFDEGKGSPVTPDVERRVHTFSAVFKNATESDESPYIDAVLRSGNFRPHFLQADAANPLIDLEKRVWHQDGPTFFGNEYIYWYLYKQAKEESVRVMLDGFDGDTTISHGTWYLVELARANRWWTWMREAWPYSKHFPSKQRFDLLLWVHLWLYQIKPSLRWLPTKRLREHARRLGSTFTERAIASCNRSGREKDLLAVVNTELLERTRFTARMAEYKRMDPYRKKTEREFHYYRLTSALLSQILEMTDRLSSAWSIEVRYPFWDRRLAEFCLAVPPTQKLNNGLIRMIMRRAMGGIIPPEIQWRGGKGDLSHGLNYGLVRQERETISKFVSQDLSELDPYVSVAEVRKACNRLMNNTDDVMDSEVVAIFKSMFLALWLQTADFSA